MGALAGLLLWRFTHPSMSLCERKVRFGDRWAGIAVCLTSYALTGDQRNLAWTARAYLHLGRLDVASEFAHRVLGGSPYGEAHGVLGYVALRRGLVSTAEMHAAIALVAHTLAGDQRGLASDSVSLSQAARQAGDFTAALDAADEALTLARQLAELHIEVVAAIARADTLRRMGDTRGAIATLTSVIERATEPCDKAWTRLKNGLSQIDAGQDGLAMVELAVTAQLNQRCGSADISSQVAMNEAWLLRWKDPAGALALLDDEAKSGEEDDVDTLMLRGYLAADRGALVDADRYLAQAANLDAPQADWPWEIACAQAELSELRGGMLGGVLAEYAYRRSAAMVAALRTTARARSAYLVSSHRGPYDGLIALLARAGRWRDVLAVVLDLDASDMLRATAVEKVSRDRPALSIETPAPRSTASLAASVDAVVSAWRSQSLVIVIAQSARQIGPGRERVYRLQLDHGEVTGEDVGDASTARKWAADLFADPGDREAARALGRMIVPPGPAVDTLHVLAIGRLGEVPLAALRADDGSLIIGRRPLVRVLALQATHLAVNGAGPPIVIADPRGDLPGAAIEGTVVAEALGARAQVSGSGTAFPATRDRLWAAHDAELLHIAGHVRVAGQSRALHLADGDVDPAEIVRRGLAPRVAVLAGCGSAAATDEEGWGSIAAALLEAGTAIVIATDRSVGDDVSLSVMRGFYAQPDWRTDPARALARVQQALDARSEIAGEGAISARSWAAFSVLARPPAALTRGAAPASAEPPVTGSLGPL